MKVWVTKYALTKGIMEFEADRCIDISPDMIAIRGTLGNMYFYGTDWHTTLADAKIRAENMRLQRIDTLLNQIEKLKELKW